MQEQGSKLTWSRLLVSFSVHLLPNRGLISSSVEASFLEPFVQPELAKILGEQMCGEIKVFRRRVRILEKRRADLEKTGRV